VLGAETRPRPLSSTFIARGDAVWIKTLRCGAPVIFGACVSILLVPFVPACFSDSSSPGSTSTTTNTGPGDTNGGVDTGGVDTPSPANTEMIDDMEANTGSILTAHGRVGAWYIYNDATSGAVEHPAGTPFADTLLNPPRGTSLYAARMDGSGFTTWGAGMGFNFHDPGDGDGGSSKTTYDASGYTGVTFWAKAGATSTGALRVNISTKDTDPAGGVCAPADKCNDHFGASLSITADWSQQTIMFSDLAQLGWGQSVPKFDPTQVYAMQFQVGKGTTFDITIDDVAFIKK
jgi:hypothetical protein